MQLTKSQIKRLAKLYAANLIRAIDCRQLKELEAEEQDLLKLELKKIADRIHWKSCATFSECYEAIINDNFNLLKGYSRRK